MTAIGARRAGDGFAARLADSERWLYRLMLSPAILYIVLLVGFPGRAFLLRIGRLSALPHLMKTHFPRRFDVVHVLLDDGAILLVRRIHVA